METIQKADPALRRTVRRRLLAAFVIALPLLGWGLPALTGWWLQYPPRQALELAGAFCAALPMPVLVFGLYVAGLGRRVVASGRFPPPGLRVIRDTPVHGGDRARRRGYALIAIGLLIAVLALAAAVGLPYLLLKLTRA